MRTLELLLQDVRMAARTLRRSAGFTIAVMAALALGIGANTAIFSLINTTLLQPLPYPDADRIVQLWFTTPGGSGLTLSIPEFNLLAQQSAVFEDVAAYDFGGPGVNITDAGEPEQVKAIHISRSYFRLFGARVTSGRTFTADEDKPSGGRVAVLSHGLWMRRFNMDPTLVGRTISLGNEPYLVAGILVPEFRPDPPAQIWLPLQADPNSVAQAHYIRAAGRLRNGVSIDQANARLKLAFEEFRRKFPLFNPKAGFQARPLRETSAGEIRTALLVLFGAVTLVLLMACSNVANLLLARATARQREISIRAAVGASRGRLVTQLLTESLLLSISGGILGLALGQMCLRGLIASNPGVVPGTGAWGNAVSLDWRVLGFTIATSLCTGILFGLAPALRASRSDLATMMKQSSSRVSTNTSAARTRPVLVIVQVALAVLLVIGAGLMIRTFAALRQVAPGIDPHRILTLEMSLRGTRFQDTDTVARLVEDGVSRIQSLPGVTAATSWTLPVELAFGSTFIIEGRPLSDGLVHGSALMRPISAEYFSVFRVPLLRGRFFTNRDTATTPGAAVISETMARKFWPNANPIGERITIDKYLGPDFAAPPREIVGVAGDVRDVAISKAPGPMIYLPQAQVPNGMTSIDTRVLPITWAVRTAAEPYSLSAAIQRELKAASGGLPVAHLRSMEEVVRHSTARSDFNALLLTAFAAVALLLAAAGIYGLIAYTVQQRTNELGIRLALGAAPHQVRNMVVFQGMRLAVAGVALGATASLGLARYMKTMVYGVKPIDPAVIAVACLTLGLIAVLAAYLPARRAARLDTVEALRAG
jgi:putative ABC transport system permease protein